MPIMKKIAFAVVALAAALTLAACSSPATAPAISHASPSPTSTTIQQAIKSLATATPTSSPEADWVAWYRAQPGASASTSDGDIITVGKAACGVIHGTVKGTISSQATIDELKATLCP